MSTTEEDDIGPDPLLDDTDDNNNDDDADYESLRTGDDEELIPELETVTGSSRINTILPRTSAQIRRSIGTGGRKSYLQSVRSSSIEIPYYAGWPASGSTDSTAAPPLSSRSFRKNVEVVKAIDVEDFTETIDANVDVDQEDPLFIMQSNVVKLEEIDENIVRRVIREHAFTTDVYVTFYWALQRQLIDPNYVMIQAILWSTGDSDGYNQEQLESIQLVALALRYDADPNLYIQLDKEDCDVIKYHILYYVHWINYPDIQGWDDENETNELNFYLNLGEQAKNRIIRLLMMAGADSTSKVISIDKKDRKTKSYVQVYRDNPNARESVYANIGADEDLEIFRTNPELKAYYDERLQIIEDIEPYQQKLYKLYRSSSSMWGDKLLEDIYMLNKVDCISVLVKGSKNVKDLPLASRFLSQKAFGMMLEKIDPKTIRGDTGNNLLSVQVECLSATGFNKLLDAGAIPEYTTIDNILSNEEEAVKSLPLSAGILADMLILCTKHGYDLDKGQLMTLKRFDGATYKRIMKIRKEIPSWKRECTVENATPSAYLREYARGVGLDPTKNKKEMCQDLDIVHSKSPDEIIDIAKARQRNRMSALANTLPEAIENTETERKKVTVKKTIKSSALVIPSESEIASDNSKQRTETEGTKTGRTKTERAGTERAKRKGTVAQRSSEFTSKKPEVTIEAEEETVITTLRAGLCKNEEYMTNDPAEYNDVDLVVYTDMEGDMWCFESQDYLTLIQTKVNPYTTKKLPKSVLSEVKSKYNTLIDAGIDLDSVPISKGLKKKTKGRANAKTKQVLHQLRDYYITYDVDPDLLSTGYTIDDMQQILMDIYSSDGRNDDRVIQLDKLNRTHALYTYANILVSDINSSEDKNATLDYIFSIIGRVNKPRRIIRV